MTGSLAYPWSHLSFLEKNDYVMKTMNWIIYELHDEIEWNQKAQIQRAQNKSVDL